MFKDRPDYRFVLGEKGEVLDIVAEPRRIANRIVEESMIAANICAAAFCATSSASAFITFIPVSTGEHRAVGRPAEKPMMYVDPTEVLTTGVLQAAPGTGRSADRFLDSRIRRFQSFAEISTEPGPHFGLGLEAYATDLADP